jgi:hypothetical protein
LSARQIPVGDARTGGRPWINGKNGDLKYKPVVTHSRPYYGYDAKFDPTILNAVRKTFTDVSGLLIAPINLPSKTNMNSSSHPLIAYGVIS